MFYRGKGFLYSDNEGELLQLVGESCIVDWSADVLQARIDCLHLMFKAKQDRSGNAYKQLFSADRQQAIHTLLLIGRPRMRHMLDFYRHVAAPHICKRPVLKLLKRLCGRGVFLAYDESTNSPFFELTPLGLKLQKQVSESGVYEWRESRLIRKMFT